MADELLEPPTGTEFPSKNDTTPAPADKPSDSGQGLLGKIVSAAGNSAEKFGLTFQRGRGRPRKDGQPKTTDKLVNPTTGEAIPAASAPALTAAVPAPQPTISQAVFHRSIIGGAKALLKTLGGYVRNLCSKAGMDAPWIDRNMRAADPDPEALADWSESLKTVLEKHNVNTENAPEWSLAVNTLRLLAPYGVMIMELRSEIKRRAGIEVPGQLRDMLASRGVPPDQIEALMEKHFK